MANLNVNKVIYGGDVLIDLTGDTVSADKILKVLLLMIRAVQRSPVNVHTTAILPTIQQPLLRFLPVRPHMPEVVNSQVP